MTAWQMICAHLDGTVVNVMTEADTLMEGSHGFPCTVDVNILFALNVTILMVYRSFYYSIPDRL